jgi:uncharacterized protein YeaO (DUF488 family)
MKQEIRIKRAYEPAQSNDGFRVLADGMWPRGVRKEDLHGKLWARQIAPSKKLRQWFGHDPKRWTQFRERYEAEIIEAAKGSL